jgi:nicotinate-nucleotide adenylyltransferase
VRERIALFGGSFDPPHVGHVLLASWALSVGGVDSLLVVPTFAHAFGKLSAPFEHRIEMARRAFSVLDPARVEVSDIEKRLADRASIDRPGDPPRPSYTVETLEALALERPSASFRLLVGADVLADLPRWRDVARIEALAPLLVGGRAGHASSAEGREVAADAPSFPEVSSTDVRSRLASGRSVGGIVPDAVIGYAANHALYERHP